MGLGRSLRQRVMISCLPVATRASMISWATSGRGQLWFGRELKGEYVRLEAPATAILTMMSVVGG